MRQRRSHDRSGDDGRGPCVWPSSASTRRRPRASSTRTRPATASPPSCTKWRINQPDRRARRGLNPAGGLAVPANPRPPNLRWQKWPWATYATGEATRQTILEGAASALAPAADCRGIPPPRREPAETGDQRTRGSLSGGQLDAPRRSTSASRRHQFDGPGDALGSPRCETWPGPPRAGRGVAPLGDAEQSRPRPPLASRTCHAPVERHHHRGHVAMQDWPSSTSG